MRFTQSSPALRTWQSHPRWPVSAAEARKRSRRATEGRDLSGQGSTHLNANGGITMRRIWTRYAFGVAALALMLASGPASAWVCDFLTGGGFIVRDTGAKANFGVGGGCKHGSPTWGHLEYIDHGMGLNVHWTSITGYFEVDSNTDSRGKPIGARRICCTARTNQFGDVDWFVLAKDTGEPGVDDEFTIRLTP